MPIFPRTKRVTDPLDDRVKDRIVGRDRTEPVYVSSSSEHSAHESHQSHDDDSDLLDCFLHHGSGPEETTTAATDDGVHGTELDSDTECDSDRTDAVIQILISTFRSQNVDRFRNVLFINVIKAIEFVRSKSSKSSNKQIVNRNIMLFLQNIGYNAAICKTKWESCGGLTSGNHEFIDVVRSDSSNSGDRYFIDVNFAGEFDIARETEHFRRISNNLPAVFVGKSEDLKQIVKLLSDATRRSLKTRGLLLPPWRKNRFMQNKWFGPYRRTVNYTPASVPAVCKLPAGAKVKCRWIGFDAVNNCNAPLLPAVARTR